MQRDETIQHLRAMLEEAARARDLIAGVQAIPALRALLQARQLGKRAIVAMLEDELKVTREHVDEKSIPRLAELIGFALQTLCPDCRSEIGKKWKEVDSTDQENRR